MGECLKENLSCAAGDASCGIDTVLARDGVWVSTTAGVSMWPMLRNRRDTIVVRPFEGRLRPLDVALYRRGDKHCDPHSRGWLAYARVWLAIRPVRCRLKRAKAALGRAVRKAGLR